MSTLVEINGDTFLPIKDASKLVSYSKDYVARLAREQKIVATQIGRQWFVDTASLKNFAHAAEIEQSIRKQQLSLERKREQTVKHEVQTIKKTTQGKAKLVKVRAQVAATLALSLGLMIGGGVYTSSALFSQFSHPTGVSHVSAVGDVRLAEELPVVAVTTSEFAPAEPQPTTLYSNVIEYPLFTDESEVRAMSSSSTQGILILPREGGIKNVSDAQGIFSDEVNVVFTEDNSGVVEYVTEAGETLEYPFVSVPVSGTAEYRNEEIE